MATGLEMMMKGMGFNVEEFKTQITGLKLELDSRMKAFDEKLDVIIRQNQAIINNQCMNPVPSTEQVQHVREKVIHAIDSGSDPSQHGIKVDPNEQSFEELEMLALQGNEHRQQA
jgi:hypothetical protein